MGKKKRILAMLMALVMILGLMPVSAFAKENTNDEFLVILEESQETTNELRGEADEIVVDEPITEEDTQAADSFLADEDYVQEEIFYTENDEYKTYEINNQRRPATSTSTAPIRTSKRT